ncbi:hypothetical protein Bbelb_247910 [Branchiostoma belcheri]|nr:hypothetical protein Bbelb_247910 [Branchiostoma belcheri]
MERADLVINVLTPFQPPGREIPENPELQPRTSTDGASVDGETAEAYFVIQGQRRMIQETVNHHRYNLRSLGPIEASDIIFRGYRAGNSILVHYTIPRKITAVLRLMASYSDPRLVFMGVTSLQIDAEAPIEVAQGALFNDIERKCTVDDIEVGCSTRTKQQRAPRNWTRLSALNLFSDALPLHLQVAASLEYQGFSYSLVQALVQKDQLREQEMKKKDQLREQEMKKLIQKAEMDSNTIMTLRSKLTISENRLKETLETNAVLEKKLQQAREYAEKAAKRVTSHVTEYRGEKPPGGWSQVDIVPQTHLAGDEGTAREEVDSGETAREESTTKDANESTERGENVDNLAEQEQPTSAGAEGAAPRTNGDFRQGKITYGGFESEPGKFWFPRGVVVSSSNEIFVADRENRRVHSTQGVYLRHFPTVVLGTEDKDMEPYDVSMDGNGTLWVVGRGESAGHVVQYSTDGTAMTQFHLQTSGYHHGIAVDMRNNHILVTDADRGEVKVFRPDGSLVRRFRHPAGEMRDPWYITVDGEGNILVSDMVSSFVFMFDESGKFLLKFGGEGSGEGQLRFPRGICTDSSGHIIVADSGNGRVQMFTRHGEYIRTIETGFMPQGVAVGPEGQLVVTVSALDIQLRVTFLTEDRVKQNNLHTSFYTTTEILERIGRQDLVMDILRPFQRPDREIPENPELEPGTSSEGTEEDGSTSNAYVVLQGQVRLVQETLDLLRNNLATLSGTRRSKVKFRGYKKHKSILVHFTIPRENTAVLRLMASYPDPRLVFMGVTSLQIDAEPPIKVAQGALFNDIKTQRTVDDIEVGCSTSTKQQRAPRNWTRLSALNLFSDALPLHLQVAASLEYQGFSYSLVQALVQNENRLKEALEANAVLEKKLQQAREYAEKAAKQVTSHVTEYSGEKSPGGWSQEYRGEKPPGGWSQEYRGEKPPGGWSQEYRGEKLPGGWSAQVEKADVATQTHSPLTGAEGAAPRTTGDFRQREITYGRQGSGPGKFRGPRGVVVSPSNEIFVADKNNRRVQVHTTEGVYLRHFPTVVPGTEDKDMKPHDVSIDSNGTLWVVGRGESGEHVVQYSTDGTAMTQFHLQKIGPYRGIAVDMRNDHILVTDADRREVEVFRPDGSLVRRFRDPAGEMSRPRYITVDGEGNILVTDWDTTFVYMYDESGKFLLKFGGWGSGEGQLQAPHGICTDSSGHIIVADWGNKRVQMFTRHGEYVRTVETEFGPEGVAVGPEGQLVVTDYYGDSVTTNHIFKKSFVDQQGDCCLIQLNFASLSTGCFKQNGNSSPYKRVAEKLKEAVDIFHKLIELDKIDQENLDFLEEILERMGRPDLVRDVLRPFQPPGREIPENPELEPGTSTDGASSDGETANAYLVVHGQRHMIQETVDRYRYNLRSLCGIRRSQVKFRGYKKGRSILMHYTIPRESTAVLRHMANNSDPRLVFMGVTSLQIDAEAPIKVAQEAFFNADIKRQRTVDDIEVGCSTRTKQQRAPRNWTRLSALNLFSDALPLHLQVAASLEYQGFSYSLVQALAEVDSNTIMTLRSKLTISENRLKEALEANAVLEKKLQQAREYAEKAAKQVTSHVTEYRGEKPPGGWSQEYRGEKPPEGWSQEYRGEKPPEGWSQVEKADVATQTHLAAHEGTAGEVDSGETSKEESTAKDTEEKSRERDEKEDKLGEQERPTSAGAEGAAPRTTGDFRQGKITYGGRGSEPGKFGYPRGVMVSSSNEIFVADVENRRVQVHSTEGVYLCHFPTVVPGTEDKDMWPQDVSMDGNGTLWVVGSGESGDHVVQYSKDGTVMTKFHLQKSEVWHRRIAVDMRNNHILVTDADLGEVEVFRPDGSLVRRFGHPEGEMSDPRYITVDGEGNILVADSSASFVYMCDESGKFLLKFGDEGSGEGQLRYPRGICTDSSGHIIVADSRNKRVQMFTRHGEYVRTVETGFQPEGVALGPEGQLVALSKHKQEDTVIPGTPNPAYSRAGVRATHRDFGLQSDGGPPLWARRNFCICCWLF